VFLEDGGGKSVYVGKIRIAVDQGVPPIERAVAGLDSDYANGHTYDRT